MEALLSKVGGNSLEADAAKSRRSGGVGARVELEVGEGVPCSSFLFVLSLFFDRNQLPASI